MWLKVLHPYWQVSFIWPDTHGSVSPFFGLLNNQLMIFPYEQSNKALFKSFN